MLRVLSFQDKRLRVVCKDINPTELRLRRTQQEIDELREFVFGSNNKGNHHDSMKPTTIGLSANQVGLTERVCIVDLAVRKKMYSDVHVLINLQISWYSKQMVYRREGCVNFPRVYGIVPRSSEVDASFLDRWGNTYRMRAKGWVAILLQHEADHLNGILFIDRLQDPTKAHKVDEEKLVAYKKHFKTWTEFVDLSKFVKKIT